MTPNSRSYLNHFTQPDTIVPDPYNSQDWDRYAYARNNPLKYTDPTGHDADCGGMAALADSYCNEAKREYHSWRQLHDTSFKTFLRAKDAYGFYYNHPEKAKKDQYAGNGKGVSSWEEVDPYTLASVYSEDIKHQMFNPISDQFITWEMDEMNDRRAAGEYVDPIEWLVNAFSLYVAWGPDGGSGGGESVSLSKLKPLNSRDISILEKAGFKIHLQKGKGSSKYNLYKDRYGNVYQGNYDQSGYGDPLNINLNNPGKP